MSRRRTAADVRAAEARFAAEQYAKQQQAVSTKIATDLKERARTARLAGLDAVTVKLPVGHAHLIGSVLAEWVQQREEIARLNAQAERAREVAIERARELNTDIEYDAVAGPDGLVSLTVRGAAKNRPGRNTL